MAKGETVVAFVPALHAGYLHFFRAHAGGSLYLLGSEFFDEYTQLTRDIRKLDPADMQKAIKGLAIFSSVKVLKKKDAPKLSAKKVVMPDEDVMHDVAGKYFKGRDIAFESVFLRWDRQITAVEHEVPAHRAISQDEFARKMLREADDEAKKSSDWWRQIGAIAMKKGKELFRAHNRHLPSDHHLSVYGDPRSNFNAGERPDIYTSIHAEADVVAQAARAGTSLAGCDIYATTFPCPNCARLLSRAGVKRVFYSKGYSLLDAEDIFKAAGIEIVLVQ